MTDRWQRRNADAPGLARLSRITTYENTINNFGTIRQPLFQPRRCLIPDFLRQRDNSFKGLRRQGVGPPDIKQKKGGWAAIVNLTEIRLGRLREELTGLSALFDCLESLACF